MSLTHAEAADFAGFPPGAMPFLADLKANNSREWFAAHKGVYETAVKAAGENFVATVAPRLEALIGEPVRPKIFRIHRDVRFSKDKRPYNAHLHISFLPGAPRENGAGFYVGLEPEGLKLGTGVWGLTGGDLDRYRAAVAHEISGGDLERILSALAGAGYRIEGDGLKRTPPPYPADHARAELLRRKSLGAWCDIDDPAVICGPEITDACLAAFQAVTPLQRWINEALE